MWDLIVELQWPIIVFVVIAIILASDIGEAVAKYIEAKADVLKAEAEALRNKKGE